MTLTAGQQLELEKPVTRFAYFAEFHFLSGIIYLSSLSHTITWGGHDWLGLGSIGGVSPVDESLGTSASAMTFTLNVAQIEWLSIATGATSEYRGRDAKLYFCPLNEQFQLVDTPVICWRGTMDTMTTGISGTQGEASGSISLKCETSAYGLKRKSSLRYNDAQQQQRHPGDTGLMYLKELIGNPDAVVWLTKKFQA